MIVCIEELLVARAQLDDASIAAATHVAALCSSVVRIGQTTNLPWWRSTKNCEYDEINKDEHAMIVLPELNEDTIDATHLRPGLASLVEEFSLQAHAAKFNLLEDNEAGVVYWAEHLNVCCEHLAAQQAQRQRSTTAIIKALACGRFISEQVCN